MTAVTDDFDKLMRQSCVALHRLKKKFAPKKRLHIVI